MKENKTSFLWQNFMLQRNRIKNRVGNELYGIEQYPHTDFFKTFDPYAKSTKWAAAKVAQTDEVPEGIQELTVPQGLYAVFHYKGKPSEA